jgi:hypothetical protein
VDILQGPHKIVSARDGASRATLGEIPSPERRKI